MEAPFIHRWNADRTIDAICTVCFQTACRASTLSLVRQGELKHECPGVPTGAPADPPSDSSSEQTTPPRQQGAL